MSSIFTFEQFLLSAVVSNESIHCLAALFCACKSGFNSLHILCSSVVLLLCKIVVRLKELVFAEFLEVPHFLNIVDKAVVRRLHTCKHNVFKSRTLMFLNISSACLLEELLCKPYLTDNRPVLYLLRKGKLCFRGDLIEHCLCKLCAACADKKHIFFALLHTLHKEGEVLSELVFGADIFATHILVIVYTRSCEVRIALFAFRLPILQFTVICSVESFRGNGNLFVERVTPHILFQVVVVAILLNNSSHKLARLVLCKTRSAYRHYSVRLVCRKRLFQRFKSRGDIKRLSLSFFIFCHWFFTFTFFLLCFRLLLLCYDFLIHNVEAGECELFSLVLTLYNGVFRYLIKRIEFTSPRGFYLSRQLLRAEIYGLVVLA